MTPPALDRGVVLAKLRSMRDLLDDLDRLPELTVDRLISDRMLRHGVERVLTQLVELAAGINSHLAAVLLGAGPVTYCESFLMAARAGVLPQQLAEELAPSAGLRNVLVHEYAEVDLDHVVDGVRLAQTGFRSYLQAVATSLPDQ